LITANQIRAARGLLGWTQADLSQQSGLALATVKRMENIGTARSTTANVQAIKRALEEAGVIFIDPNGEGAGVRLRRNAGDFHGGQIGKD